MLSNSCVDRFWSIHESQALLGLESMVYRALVINHRSVFTFGVAIFSLATRAHVNQLVGGLVYPGCAGLVVVAV